jgi:two-component system sensor histidine kinase KdpD
MRRAAEQLLSRSERPPASAGLAVAVGSVAVVTGLLYALKQIVPVVSLGVVYLLAVLLVSTVWGARLGVLTSVLSAAAFNFFHLPPLGRFAISDDRNWLTLVVFLLAAIFASSLAELARSRAAEAEARRREAVLSAELARVLLGAEDVPVALGIAARRLAETLGLPSAAIELARPGQPGPEGAIALAGDEGTVGWLVVPRGRDEEALARVASALGSILAAALVRQRLQAEVVETASLRRSDELKTALLRSVSHDLRTPVTAILAAAAALGSPAVEDEEREALERGIVADAGRLDRLIDQLLDLSRLEGGVAEPRWSWVSIDELLRDAAEHVTTEGARFTWAIDPDLPLVHADPVQLERAFANLVDNAARHGAGHPVSIRARAVGEHLRVRIVDRGPGIPPAEQERIFAPFYQSPAEARAHRGTGLGLAIAKGFVEANGGRISVESLPHQGTSFVVELPLQPEPDPVRA